MSLTQEESDKLRLSLVDAFLKNAANRGSIQGIAEGANHGILILSPTELPDQQIKAIKDHARQILGRDPQKTELSLIGPFPRGEIKPL